MLIQLIQDTIYNGKIVFYFKVNIHAIKENILFQKVFIAIKYLIIWYPQIIIPFNKSKNRKYTILHVKGFDCYTMLNFNKEKYDKYYFSSLKFKNVINTIKIIYYINDIKLHRKVKSFRLHPRSSSGYYINQN